MRAGRGTGQVKECEVREVVGGSILGWRESEMKEWNRNEINHCIFLDPSVLRQVYFSSPQKRLL